MNGKGPRHARKGEEIRLVSGAVYRDCLGQLRKDHGASLPVRGLEAGYFRLRTQLESSVCWRCDWDLKGDFREPAMGAWGADGRRSGRASATTPDDHQPTLAGPLLLIYTLVVVPDEPGVGQRKGGRGTPSDLETKEDWGIRSNEWRFPDVWVDPGQIHH